MERLGGVKVVDSVWVEFGILYIRGVERVGMEIRVENMARIEAVSYVGIFASLRVVDSLKGGDLFKMGGF